LGGFITVVVDTVVDIFLSFGALLSTRHENTPRFPLLEILNFNFKLTAFAIVAFPARNAKDQFDLVRTS
jgi:hypothetical protein